MRYHLRSYQKCPEVQCRGMTQSVALLIRTYDAIMTV